MICTPVKGKHSLKKVAHKLPSHLYLYTSHPQYNSAKKLKPAVASGLHSDWRDRASGNVQKGQGNLVPHDVDNKLGGFIDADVEANPPLADANHDDSNSVSVISINPHHYANLKG